MANKRSTETEIGRVRCPAWGGCYARSPGLLFIPSPVHTTQTTYSAVAMGSAVGRLRLYMAAKSVSVASA
jgi:hypothetical protein